MDEKVLQVLRRWKKRQFFDNHVQFANVAKQLRNGTEPFKFVALNSKKWMCMSKETGSPTVFTYPVLWISNSDLRAGNYLPEEVQDEEGLNFKPVRKLSIWQSKIVYKFDISLDDSFVKHIKVLEEYVQRNENFNLSNRKRKKWQDASNLAGIYQVEHKLFVPAGTYTQIPDDDLDGVHPWLIDAIRNQDRKQLNLNVPFPTCVNFVDHEPTTSILEEDPPTFNRGDVVVMTFRLGFIVGADDWWPEILPEEFIRVETANRDSAGRYSESRWPGRDPNVKRLMPHRQSGHIQSAPGPSHVDVRGKDIEVDQVNDHDAMASEVEEPDDDSLSQHSAESIKRRIGKLAVDEDMIVVEGPVDEDEDMEKVQQKPAKRRIRR